MVAVVTPSGRTSSGSKSAVTRMVDSEVAPGWASRFVSPVVPREDPAFSVVAAGSADAAETPVEEVVTAEVLSVSRETVGAPCCACTGRTSTVSRPVASSACGRRFREKGEETVCADCESVGI